MPENKPFGAPWVGTYVQVTEFSKPDAGWQVKKLGHKKLGHGAEETEMPGGNDSHRAQRQS